MILAPPGTPPAEPGMGSARPPRPTTRAPSSNDPAEEVASCLEFRGVRPSEVEYDPRFDSAERSEAVGRNFLQSHLGLCGVGGKRRSPLERCWKGLLQAFDGTYNEEGDFNIELFKAMSQCFEAANGSKFAVEYFPPKKDWTEKNPSFMVITGRRRRIEDIEVGAAREREEGEEEAGRPNRPCPSAASADDVATATATARSADKVVNRITRFVKNKRLRSGASQRGSDGRPGGAGGAGGAGGGADGASDCGSDGNRREPFRAHAQFFASRAANSDEKAASGIQDPATREGERPTSQRPPSPQRMLQRREYALGLAREVHVPENKYGIVRFDSYLNHAVVLFSRDPVEKERENGGWTVCQVLATVEIKVEDSTCHEFERTRDTGRIRIESSDLARKKAAPFGQEVLYTLGHVVWSRAALGLELPPSLPLAVVAARRVGGTDYSERKRWVYGNLILPEECGGSFSFSVSSSGSFLGTDPKSAAAAYLTVLMEGLEAGERWIVSMQANSAMSKKAPPMPPPCDDGQGPSSTVVDTRPGPRSVCGRRLYFGGSPLEMSGMELVATPASMRKMELAISQGELYRGRVNLAELRDPVKGWSPNVHVRWSNASEAQTNATLPAGALEKSTRFESRQDEAFGAVQAVCVKVSSLACHRMLLLPDQALLWGLADDEGWYEVVESVLPLISESLHAVHLTGGFNRNLGIVQIMPDLLAAGYLPLRPNEILDKKVMCEAFKSLIERTLVPLALHRVVHADIRPRYQETANILCRSQANYFSMLLIDLDSLMEIAHFKNLPKDDRILSAANGPYSEGIGSALEYVCLQSVCIATSWLIGKRIADLSGDESAASNLEEELKTETMIKKYLLANVKRGEKFDKQDRALFFSSLKRDPVSFVLKQVDPILKTFLGEWQCNERFRDPYPSTKNHRSPT